MLTGQVGWQLPKSTQVPRQLVGASAGQIRLKPPVQVPAEQVPLQAWPQEPQPPQLLGSVSGSMQAPPQFSSPATGHTMSLEAPLQSPPEHVSPGGQT
jgi:hypothetical protein